MIEKCWCGCSNIESITLDYTHVAQSGSYSKSSDTINVSRCVNCGSIRQSDPPYSNDTYSDYYKEYEPTKPEYKAKGFKHDHDLAKIRCEQYKLYTGSDVKLLDIGSGSGAFVFECLERNIDACGCEIAKYSDSFSKQIYYSKFEDISFPTCSFDVLTCHDVLEHVLDLNVFLKEAFRVLKDNGTFHIDLPNAVEGKHHWKKEHIWYFNEESATKLFESIGFVIESVNKPIAGKFVFTLRKPEQTRPTILMPPGIGDSYWSVVKLRSFLKWKGLHEPDVSIVCPKYKAHNGHLRAFPFLEMFPFLKASWETVNSTENNCMTIWREAYGGPGRTIFENVLGHDYFISYNGHLRVGHKLDDVDLHLKCDWYSKLFISLAQEEMKNKIKTQYGKYILFYFVFQGTYKYWTNEFSIASVISAIRMICDKSGCIPVFVGGTWDKFDESLNSVVKALPYCIDMIGKTTVQQLFGLIRGAEMVVGYPSGLTISSAMLRQKTLVLWNTYYNPDFFWNAMPPDTHNKTYFVDVTLGLTDKYLSDRVQSILVGNPIGQRSVKRINKDYCDASFPRVVEIKKEPLKNKSNEDKSPLSQPIVKRHGIANAVSVICVLKSGGDYTPDYVERLFNMLERNIGTKFEFICLTDIDFTLSNCRMIKLESDLPGWWSKIELFRPGLSKSKYLLYFDLDTVIINSVDCVLGLNSHSFIALDPFNARKKSEGALASGMMKWESNLYHFLYEKFNKDLIETEYAGKGDQDYIWDVFKRNGIPFGKLQNDVPGIYSFKKHCSQRLPRDARIVCFHGNPRPKDVTNSWMSMHWK